VESNHERDALSAKESEIMLQERCEITVKHKDREWRKFDKKLTKTLFYSVVYLGSYLIFFKNDSLVFRGIFLGLAVILYFFFKLDSGFFRSLFFGLTLQIPGLILIFYFVDSRFDTAIVYAMNYYVSIYYMILVSYIFIKKVSMMELIRIFRFFGLSPSLSTVIAISVIFLPVLVENLRKIFLMQKLRGYSMLKNGLEPILVPAIAQIFDYSISIALSCYQRGLFN
jgi:hypothetical protein